MNKKRKIKTKIWPSNLSFGKLLLIILITVVFAPGRLYALGSIDVASNASSFTVTNATELCARITMIPTTGNGTFLGIAVDNLPFGGISSASLRMTGPEGFDWTIASLTVGNHPASPSPLGRSVEVEVTAPQDVSVVIDHWKVSSSTKEEWFVCLMSLRSTGNTLGELDTRPDQVGEFTDIYLKPQVDALVGVTPNELEVDEGTNTPITASFIQAKRHRNIATGTWDDAAGPTRMTYSWNSSWFVPSDALITNYNARWVNADVTDTFTLTVTAGLLRASDDIKKGLGSSGTDWI